MDFIPSEERSRRQSIVRAIEEVSVQIGHEFVEQDVNHRNRDLIISEIQAMSQRALNMFQEGDEGVAWWTQVELYSALAEPLSLVFAGRALTNGLGEPKFTLPRVGMLESWSEGTSPGPRFRGQEDSAPDNVDYLRESFVRPFSEAPDDMVWAKILHWSNKTTDS